MKTISTHIYDIGLICGVSHQNQTIFIRFYRIRKGFNNKKSIPAWLCSVTKKLGK